MISINSTQKLKYQNILGFIVLQNQQFSLRFKITLFREVSILRNSNILCHLKLEITSPIAASIDKNRKEQLGSTRVNIYKSSPWSKKVPLYKLAPSNSKGTIYTELLDNLFTALAEGSHHRTCSLMCHFNSPGSINCHLFSVNVPQGFKHRLTI